MYASTISYQKGAVLTVVIVKRWISFHPWGDGLFYVLWLSNFKLGAFLCLLGVVKPGPQLKITRKFQKYQKIPEAREGKSTMEAYRRNDDTVTKGTKKHQIGAFLCFLELVKPWQRKRTKNHRKHGGWEGRQSLQTEPRHNDKTQGMEKHQKYK